MFGKQKIVSLFALSSTHIWSLGPQKEEEEKYLQFLLARISMAIQSKAFFHSLAGLKKAMTEKITINNSLK